MCNQIDNEIPKYIKQKESDISKADKKSKHKHQYEECLIQYNMKTKLPNKPTILKTTLSSYCTICGKINGIMKNSIVTDYKRKGTRLNGETYYYHMSDEELYNRYHNRLPVFFVEDKWKDNYVKLKPCDR